MRRAPALVLAALASNVLAACSAVTTPDAASTAPTSGAAFGTESAEAAPPSGTARGTESGEDAPVHASSASLADPEPPTPADLPDRLAQGGLVIVHRYTGATRPSTPDPVDARFIDDGQRMSAASAQSMAELRAKYAELSIPVGRALSSEYYFVYEHASAAMDGEVGLERALTGSLNFSDTEELAQSLQDLRDLTVTPPAAGTNTVLFTHQGKFDKAYGYFLEAGWTLIFEPDGSGTPRVIASMPLEEFLALEPRSPTVSRRMHRKTPAH